MNKLFSAFDFQQTRQRLLANIKSHGLVLFGEFDHAKAAAEVELILPPTTVLIFGNPKGGTALMLQNPELALDLPFRVLISQQPDGLVWVGFHPVETLEKYGLDTHAIQALKKLENLVEQSIASID
ncbi:DUF302 domain-containing protein [Citrobacter freundii]|jgi:uncharacterized protein (DUF302 family)|nr:MULTISPECIES: DUF302 domain-containing protein [Citrobacter]QLY68614.1 DUF302 domain-containing protein [Citrobacter freundii]TKV23496.1 DUF302 domain-containing protein [Citrobacter sp. wls613]